MIQVFLLLLSNYSKKASLSIHRYLSKQLVFLLLHALATRKVLPRFCIIGELLMILPLCRIRIPMETKKECIAYVFKSYSIIISCNSTISKLIQFSISTPGINISGHINKKSNSSGIKRLSSALGITIREK